jgi:hypothetical protein
VQWGDPTSTAGATLLSRYSSVYDETAASAVKAMENPAVPLRPTSRMFPDERSYLPASGGFGALTADLVDPTSSSSGVFGGEVVALELNVDFSDAGELGRAVALGDLRICGFEPLPVVNGMMVREVQAHIESLLGGGGGPFTVAQATSMAAIVNASLIDGTPSQFAQEDLVNGPCP